jgi:uncharacterized membrane protein YoaK (UPF0700 family)
MTLVSAMAVQNAVQRQHLSNSPPTTLMTGNTTQVVFDVVDHLRGIGDAATIRARLAHMVSNIAGFAAGCAAAALLFAAVGVWCFAMPPVLGLVAVVVRAESLPPRKS